MLGVMVFNENEYYVVLDYSQSKGKIMIALSISKGYFFLSSAQKLDHSRSKVEAKEAAASSSKILRAPKSQNNNKILTVALHGGN